MSEHYDEFTFTHDGGEFRARLYYDHTCGAPWKEEDGHGPVRESRAHYYTGRHAKAPGEMILYSERGFAWVYDYAEACRIALREGWDSPPYNTGTKRERAARAAMADFRRLEAWCNDRWHWCGVVVDIPGSPYSASLWGIESDAGDYLKEVCAELAAEVVAEIAAAA